MSQAAQSSEPEYEFIKLLGRGGMAEVFLAHKLTPGGGYKEIAFKRILPHVMHEPARISRFLDEIALAAALVHPNIAGIHHWGVYCGDHFIEMEYVQGVTLKQLIEPLPDEDEDGPLRPLEPVEVVLLGAMMADALHYAHNFERREIRGVVHRDISPDNVMLTLEAHAKVLDFGIAKALKGSERVASETQSAAGKPLYHPPEQWQGKGITARTDLYAIGTTLAVALTGRQLFATKPDETFESLIFRVFQGDRPRVAELAPAGAPPPLVELIERLVSVSAGDRPESAQVVSRELHAMTLRLTGGDPYPARKALMKRIAACYAAHGGAADTERKLDAVNFTKSIPSKSTRRPVDPSTRLDGPAPADGQSHQRLVSSSADRAASAPHVAATTELPAETPAASSWRPLLLATLAALALVLFALVAGVVGFLLGDFGDRDAAGPTAPGAPQESPAAAAGPQPATSPEGHTGPPAAERGPVAETPTAPAVEAETNESETEEAEADAPSEEPTVEQATTDEADRPAPRRRRSPQTQPIPQSRDTPPRRTRTGRRQAGASSFGI